MGCVDSRYTSPPPSPPPSPPVRIRRNRHPSYTGQYMIRSDRNDDKVYEFFNLVDPWNPE